MKVQLFLELIVVAVLFFLCMSGHGVRLNIKQNPEEGEENNDLAEGLGEQIAAAEENPEEAETSLPTNEELEKAPPAEKTEKVEIPVPVQNPPTIITPQIPATAPGSITITNQNGCGECCTESCETKTGKGPSDLSELNSSIQQVYARAAAANLPVETAPNKINSLKEADAAVSGLESVLKVQVGTKIPTEEVVPKSAEEAAAPEGTEKVAPEIVGEEKAAPKVVAEEETAEFLQTKRVNSKNLPRFTQQDEDADDEAIQEAKEAEEQTDEGAEEEAKTEPAENKKTTAALEGFIWALESTINDIASQNSGVKDLLLTQQRLAKKFGHKGVA